MSIITFQKNNAGDVYGAFLNNKRLRKMDDGLFLAKRQDLAPVPVSELLPGVSLILFDSRTQGHHCSKGVASEIRWLEGIDSGQVRLVAGFVVCPDCYRGSISHKDYLDLMETTLEEYTTPIPISYDELTDEDGRRAGFMVELLVDANTVGEACDKAQAEIDQILGQLASSVMQAVQSGSSQH